ncbi:MAG: TIGR02266 family protein [Myxococcota bacterium]|nr:TIGR02266 family protein [Myxococcota bacterium]
MADPAQAPIGLKVKLPFQSPEEFISKYGANLSRGGIYLRSRTLKPPGTAVTLELQLQDGRRLIYASAVVAFVTGQKGTGISGMGLRFLTLDPETKRFLDTATASLPHANSSQPPLPSGAGEPDYGTPTAQAPAPSSAPPVPQLATPPRPKAAPTLNANAPVVAVGSGAQVSAPPFEEPKEEPKRTGPIIGIDLGTTNSCASMVRNNKPAVLTSREGHNTVPSIIALNARGKIVIGHPAKGQMLTNPRLTVYGAKRLVGRAYDSPIVQQIKDRFAYEIVAGEGGESAVKLGSTVYSLQQISALVLREVREVAQNQLGQSVSRAVITVPAYYNDNQRQAVREAGRLAGIHVERILNEPTAAALAYGFGRDLKQRVLVYDLGGGTFDASVLELSGNVYEVISTGGDTFLGGLDFDNAIVAFLLEEFAKKNGKPFHSDRVAMQRITDAAERAKCALSERAEVRVHVPFVTMIDNQPLDLDVTLNREQLVSLTEKLVDRTLAVCDEVLKAKGLGPKDVDEVILVGGQSRFPLVHRKIEAFFGRPASKGVHPDEAVAVGASLLANSLGQLEGVVLIDVLPMAIGIGLPGGRFKPVLERNCALPATKRYTIGTSRDDQPELDLAIFQGDSDKAQENEYLGTLRLTGLPRGARGSVKIEVTFEVSNEALLKVKGRELSTGREVESTFSTRDTPETVKARLTSEDGSSSSPAAPGASGPKQRVPPGTPSAEVAAAANSGGFLGWVRRLFGR